MLRRDAPPPALLPELFSLTGQVAVVTGDTGVLGGVMARGPARAGAQAELISTSICLCSPGASFVNGLVVPVDGGFSAFSGV